MIWGKCRGKNNALKIVKNQPPKITQWSESPGIHFYNLCQEINSHNTYALVINILGGLNTLVSLEEVIVFHNHVILKQKKSSCTFGSMYLTYQQTTQKMAKGWGPSSCFIFWGWQGHLPSLSGLFTTVRIFMSCHWAFGQVLLGLLTGVSHLETQKGLKLPHAHLSTPTPATSRLCISTVCGGKSQAPPSLSPLLHV